MNRLTYNQTAMLRALVVRDWQVHEVTGGQSRTVNSLIHHKLVEIERVGGIRWIRITDSGRAAL